MLHQDSASGLVVPPVSALRMGLLGWAPLQRALLDSCHCASVAVNLASLPEASKVQKGSSFLLLTPLVMKHKRLFRRFFPYIINLSSINLTPEIYDKQRGVMSSSGSGKSPVLERDGF